MPMTISAAHDVRICVSYVELKMISNALSMAAAAAEFGNMNEDDKLILKGLLGDISGHVSNWFKETEEN